MNEIVERRETGVAASESHRFSAAEIRQRVNLVQEVMRNLMIENTHYGVIPGTKKPSLYKPGAEMLCVTFRIADEYHVEDLTANGMSRFRVRCVGRHQVTGVVLGEGLGACSSGEEKYKWRAAICTEEFDITPETMRRLKFSKWNNKVEKKLQIRTEPEDQENTILKMACKRAKIAMTLNVTGASDIFTQDIEDIPEELRHEDESAAAPAQEAKALPVMPAEKFTANKAEWKKFVEDGKYESDRLIAFLSTKATLTAEQKAEIASWKKLDATPPADDAFVKGLDAAEEYVPE